MTLSVPEPRFVIVAHRPRTRALLLAAAFLWAVSLVVAWQVSRQRAAPALERLITEQAGLREERNGLRMELADARRDLAMARRSEQVVRGANQQLQGTLREREEEIASLRADVGFYERLVGGSAQRQGLSVHSLELRADDGGSYRYALTLTQSLKKGRLTRGEVSLTLEGVQSGRLTSLAWRDLRQDADAAPQSFEFRYFQQIEGSIMLPPDFTPQRIRVVVRADGQQSERVFPWRDALRAEQGA